MPASRFLQMGAGALLLALSGLAAAQAQDSEACPDEAVAIAGSFAKVVKLRPASDDSLVQATACKAWPGKEAWTIGVFVWESAENEVRMLVALLGQGKVVASYHSQFERDALARYYQGSVRIDTARYQLRAGVRAFGVDVATQAPRYADGGYGPLRTLYVREGEALRPVLSDMSMSKWSYADATAPAGKSHKRRDPVVETTNYAIGMASTSSHGYADLIVTAMSDKPKAKPVSTVLRYNGEYYPAPD